MRYRVTVEALDQNTGGVIASGSSDIGDYGHPIRAKEAQSNIRLAADRAIENMTFELEHTHRRRPPMPPPPPETRKTPSRPAAAVRSAEPPEVPFLRQPVSRLELMVTLLLGVPTLLGLVRLFSF